MSCVFDVYCKANMSCCLGVLIKPYSCMCEEFYRACHVRKSVFNKANVCIQVIVCSINLICHMLCVLFDKISSHVCWARCVFMVL